MNTEETTNRARFKMGDTVKMVNCIEAEAYKGRVWVCRGHSFRRPKGDKYEEVFLEGFAGSFLCDFLEPASPAIVIEAVPRTSGEHGPEGYRPDNQVLPQETTTQNIKTAETNPDYGNWCQRFSELTSAQNIGIEADDQFLRLCYMEGKSPEQAVEVFKVVARRIKAIQASYKN